MRSGNTLLVAISCLATAGCTTNRDNTRDPTDSAQCATAVAGPATTVVLTATASAGSAGSGTLARLRPGMSAAEVRRLLGPPAEIRTQQPDRSWIVGAAAAWTYGVLAPGGFARSGLVLMDERQRVLSIRSPVERGLVRPLATAIPLSDKAVASPAGMICRLAAAIPDEHGVTAEVALLNTGSQPFRFAHDHTFVKFNLVVELYNADKELLSREDMLSYHSPHSSDQSKWPVLTIAPGGERSERVQLGSGWREFGPLPAGRYFVRVAFPFENTALFPSNLLPIEL